MKTWVEKLTFQANPVSVLTRLRPGVCVPSGRLLVTPLSPGALRRDLWWTYTLSTEQGGRPFLRVCSGIAQNYFTSQAGGQKKASSGQTGPDETWAQLNTGCIESSRDRYTTFNQAQHICLACGYRFTKMDTGILLCRSTDYRSWK